MSKEKQPSLKVEPNPLIQYISTEDLTKALSKEVAEEVAIDIAQAFVTKANNENLDIDYHLSGGKMVESLDNANTAFAFDTEEGTTLRKVQRMIVEVFSEDFDEEDEVAVSRMKNRRERIDEFRERVRTILNSGKFHQQITSVLRKVAFGNIPEFLLPIDIMRFLEIEIGDVGEDDFLLVIEKFAKVDPATGGYLEPPQFVQQDLFERYKATGKPFDEIISQRKEVGDEMYDLVAGATAKRYSFEIHCSIAADYSFCERPVEVPDSSNSKSEEA